MDKCFPEEGIVLFLIQEFCDDFCSKRSYPYFLAGSCEPSRFNYSDRHYLSRDRSRTAIPGTNRSWCWEELEIQHHLQLRLEGWLVDWLGQPMDFEISRPEGVTALITILYGLIGWLVGWLDNQWILRFLVPEEENFSISFWPLRRT